MSFFSSVPARIAFCLFIQTTFLSSAITASPLGNIDKRAAVDCTNPAAVFDESCWLPEDKGGIDPGKYLADPVTGKPSLPSPPPQILPFTPPPNQIPPQKSDTTTLTPLPKKGWFARTPKCTTDTASGIDCCEPDEAWSTCFIRLARGLSGADCSSINAQKCTWDQEVSGELDPSIRAHVCYVLKNIFDINNFFTTYYNGEISSISLLDILLLFPRGSSIAWSSWHRVLIFFNVALQDAGSHAALMVSSLTTTFNDVKSSVPLLNILSALTAALAFLAVCTSPLPRILKLYSLRAQTHLST